MSKTSRAQTAAVFGVILISMAPGGCAPEAARSEFAVDALPVLSLEVEARIGSVDDPDTGFSENPRLDVDSDGNLYVMERMVPEMRVFDPDGVLMRRIGARGEGPGEFGRTPRFGVEGDTVWALDFSLNRVTLFDREGVVRSSSRIEEVTVALPPGYGYVLPEMMRSDGTFLGHLTRIASRRGDDTEVESLDSIPVPFVRFDGAGNVIDTVGWADRPPPRMWRPPNDDKFEYNLVEFGGRRWIAPSPLSNLPRWVSLSDGYVVVDAPPAELQPRPAITVTRIDLEGDTVYHRDLHYEPIPYTGAVLDTIAAHAARGEPGGMVPYSPQGNVVPDNWRSIAAVLRAAMDFPEYQPAIAYPWAAKDGSIWIRLWNGNDPTAHWVVIDPQGGVAGRVELASDARVLWHEDDVVWVSEPDEYDVPWLVRYRLENEVPQ